MPDKVDENIGAGMLSVASNSLQIRFGLPVQEFVWTLPGPLLSLHHLQCCILAVETLIQLFLIKFEVCVYRIPIELVKGCSVSERAEMQTTSKEKLYITLHKPDSMWLFDSWLPWSKNCVIMQIRGCLPAVSLKSPKTLQKRVNS